MMLTLSRRAATAVSRVARWMTHIGTALVLGGAVVGALSRWDGPNWRGVWTFLIVVAAISLCAGLVRITLGPDRWGRPDRASLVGVLICSLVAWAAAAAAAASTSRFFRADDASHLTGMNSALFPYYIGLELVVLIGALTAVRAAERDD